MPRAQWAVAALTVTLLCVGAGMLHRSEGAEPAALGSADALPSRALGLSGHRRLVRELEQGGVPDQAPAQGTRPARGPAAAAVLPMRAARPVRLRIPSLGVDVPVGDDRHGGGAAEWDDGTPAPGTAGTALVTGEGLHLAGLRRGRTIEIARADHRTAVFTVSAVERRTRTRAVGGEPAAGATRVPERPGRAGLRLVSGDTTVLARLTGRHHTR